MVNDRAGVVLDRLRVEFDDERAVANAGLLLSASLAGRLGIEALVNETVDLAGRPGAAGPRGEGATLLPANPPGGRSDRGRRRPRFGRNEAVGRHQPPGAPDPS